MDKQPAPRKWVVSPDELAESSKTRRVRLVDARREALYSRAHLGGSLSLPLSKLLTWDGQKASIPTKGEVDGLMSGLGATTDDWLVLYDDHRGLHASRALWTLEHFGYWNLSVIDRDFSGITKAELVSPSPSPTEEKAPQSKEQPEGHLITKSELLSIVEKGEARIIDCRDTNLFPVGHLPGARNLPWHQLSGHGLNFLGPNEIQINTGRLQLEGREIVLYCGSGLNSAHTYVALRSAGFKNVKVYAATFGEWLSSGAPVERGWQTLESKPETVQ